MTLSEEVEGYIMNQCSDKSYARAVILSGIFGTLGIQHFYLGRYFEGFLDLGLSTLALYCLFTDQIILAIIAFGADIIHSLIVTILLLIGSFKDGKGYNVCYPGQKLS